MLMKRGGKYWPRNVLIFDNGCSFIRFLCRRWQWFSFRWRVRVPIHTDCSWIITIYFKAILIPCATIVLTYSVVPICIYDATNTLITVCPIRDTLHWKSIEFRKVRWKWYASNTKFCFSPLSRPVTIRCFGAVGMLEVRLPFLGANITTAKKISMIAVRVVCASHRFNLICIIVMVIPWISSMIWAGWKP
jgi:hypothetical protein